MTVENPNFAPLVTEALCYRERFHLLPEDVRYNLISGVSDIVVRLALACGERWNNVGFDQSRIIVCEKDLTRDLETIGPLAQRVKECGLKGRSASSLITGSIRDTVFMLQLKVTSMSEVENIRGKYKRLKAGSEGRALHTTKSAPTNTKYTTLLRKTLPKY